MHEYKAGEHIEVKDLSTMECCRCGKEIKPIKPIKTEKIELIVTDHWNKGTEAKICADKLNEVIEYINTKVVKWKDPQI